MTEKELDSNMDLSSMLGQTGEGNDTIATYETLEYIVFIVPIFIGNQGISLM